MADDNAVIRLVAEVVREFCAGHGGDESRAEHWRALAMAAKREHEAMRAEVARLHKLFDDAGQGEHNVLALIDHYQDACQETAHAHSEARAELAARDVEVARLRAEVARLAALHRDPRIAAAIDELRRCVVVTDAASAERIAALEGLLRDARARLARESEPQTLYGAFHGGDPREFCPDPEVCTEDELRAHRDACDAWNRGERPKPSPEPRVGGVCDGAHAEGASYGLGTYEVRDDEAADLLARIEAALAAKGK